MELEAEIREFLIECNEYMEMLDRDILLLEESPDDAELISSVFRAVHTIKGTCGFFGFDSLGSLTHAMETLLGQVRERERTLTPQLVSLTLEALDVVRVLLGNIENTGAEGDDIASGVRLRLDEAAKMPPSEQRPSDTAPELASHQALSAVATPAAPVAVISPVAARTAEPLATILEPVQPKPLSNKLPLPSAVAPEVEAEAEADGGRDGGKDAALTDSTIRVDVNLLDRLMNLVGELVLARNQLLQDTSSQNSSLQQTSQRLNLITSELQEGVMKTRMQPIGVVWNKLPRVVRDLAAKCGKLVRIEMEGAGTELDKTIIEAIKDPLTHIVRNACDHGIEPPEVRNGKGKSPEGLLLLRAFHEGGVVNIEISDDGAGIDPQRIRNKSVEKGLLRAEQVAALSDRDALHLVFLPGFSTAEQISSVSGRGVGMDVVKTNIEKIGGSVEILNRVPAGTTIRIKIPLTLAIIPGLVIGLNRQAKPIGSRVLPAAQERFIIPQANLLELVRIEATDIKKRIGNVHGTPVFHHRRKLLPIIFLAEVLGMTEGPHGEAMNIVVLQAESKQLGLVVDHIFDTQEIVVKPLGRQLKGLSCYVGATIMGDGRPALILDVAGLARLAQLGSTNRSVVPGVTEQVDAEFQAEPQMLMLFRAGPYQRMAVPLTVVDRLEEVPVAQVEQSGGRPVLHYRGAILPLLSMGEPGADLRARKESDSVLQIIVFTNGQQRIGLIVDEFLDIVNEPVISRHATAATGLLGSAVIDGKVTDLLDVFSLASAGDADWLAPNLAVHKVRRRLLLVDSAPFSREFLGERLTRQGYEVSSFSSVKDALQRMRDPSLFAAVVLSTYSTEGFRQQFAEAASQDEAMRNLPLLELVDEGRPCDTGPLASIQFSRSDIGMLINQLPALIGSGPLREVHL